MGFLEDVKKKLVSPGGEAFSRERFEAQRPAFLRLGGRTGSPPPLRPAGFYDAAEAARHRRKIFVRLGLVLASILAVALLTAGALDVYREFRTVQLKHVAIALTAPERVTSGEDVVLTAVIENRSRVTWENVALTLDAPEGFAFKSATPAPAVTDDPRAWAIGVLSPRAAAEVQLRGRLVGEEGTTGLFTLRVKLSPQNRPTEPKEKTTIASVVLAEAPVDLTIEVPRSAASGTPIVVTVVAQNRLARDLVGARVRLAVPPGFSLAQAEPPPLREETLVWELPTLPPQGQAELTVRGTVEGEPEATKPFAAEIGILAPDGRFLAQRRIQRSLVIERAGLTLTQTVENDSGPLKVTPGEELAGEVRYKNTGTRGLRELIVRLTVDGAGLDVGAVKVEGGFFDSTARTITWTAASTPDLLVLRPGESGSLRYTFRILSPAELPFTGGAERNFALTLRAIGDSPDLVVPPGAPKEVAASAYQILLNTVPALSRDAFYDDGRAGLPVSRGPLPLRVGEETTLSVRVRIENTSNEILDATVRTVLPEGIRWLESEYHTTGEVRFNERTRDIVWTVPLVPARAGLALPSPEFTFQVGLTPSLTQAGGAVPLTKGFVLEGTDAFTAARVRAEAEAVTTKTVDERRGQVVR